MSQLFKESWIGNERCGKKAKRYSEMFLRWLVCPSGGEPEYFSNNNHPRSRESPCSQNKIWLQPAAEAGHEKLFNVVHFSDFFAKLKKSSKQKRILEVNTWTAADPEKRRIEFCTCCCVERQGWLPWISLEAISPTSCSAWAWPTSVHPIIPLNHTNNRKIKETKKTSLHTYPDNSLFLPVPALPLRDGWPNLDEMLVVLVGEMLVVLVGGLGWCWVGFGCWCCYHSEFSCLQGRRHLKSLWYWWVIKTTEIHIFIKRLCVLLLPAKSP